MPTWWQGHNIIHFAANKKHIGLYPGPEAVVQFAEKLDQAGYKYSKGSIQIPWQADLKCRIALNCGMPSAGISTPDCREAPS